MKKTLVVIGSAALCLSLHVSADEKPKKDPPSLAGKASAPPSSNSKSSTAPARSVPSVGTPGLARKTKLPPGLAKKFGNKRQNVSWVAIDPMKPDQAWLLIDNKWILEKGFDFKVKNEVKASLSLPVARPQVAPPNVGAKLHVVKFN